VGLKVYKTISMNGADYSMNAGIGDYQTRKWHDISAQGEALKP